ncbi:MAG TPA: serine hydrolase, partial [Thermoanaerobaculia bacterium]
MKLLRILLVLFVATFALGQQPNLEGLWRAQRFFPVEIHGTLILEREGDAWRADVAGRNVPAQVEKNRITFDLGADGSFRGELQNDRIAGHWTQLRSVSGGYPFATPVTLTKERANRWRGTIAPLPDSMTFFLPVTREADGTLRTFLRNPERNVGIFIGPAKVEVEASAVQLAGRRNVSGRYDAESDTISLAIRGATYDFERYTLPPLPAWSYRKPMALDDGWSVASAEEVGLDMAALTPLVAMLREPPVGSLTAYDVHALLIARNGKMVVEEYFRGAHREQLHDTRSAAKVVASILAGAAKVPASTKVYAAFGRTPADPRAQKLTLDHLLTMSSGLDCDDSDENSPGNEDRMQEQTEQPDWYRLILDLKMIREPGEKATYCSIQPHLAGGVLQRAAGRPLPELMYDVLGKPLQMSRYYLSLAPNGDVYGGG